MSKTKVNKVKNKIGLSRQQSKFKHLLKVNRHFSLSSDVSGPKRTLDYSGVAIKKQQAAIKDALVKLLKHRLGLSKLRCGTVQYSELDEILKNEGHSFSSKSVTACVKKTFPGVSYALRSKTFEGLGRITPGAIESQQQEEQEDDEEIFENKVTLLLRKNFELQQTMFTYFRGFTQEVEEDMLFMNLLQEKIDAVS